MAVDSRRLRSRSGEAYAGIGQERQLVVPKLTYAEINAGHYQMESAMGRDGTSRQLGGKVTALDRDAGTFRGNQNDFRVPGIG